jgi:outer membrane autotransporter protein
LSALASDILNAKVANTDMFVNSVNQISGQLATERAGISWDAPTGIIGYSKDGNPVHGKLDPQGTRNWNIWAQAYGDQRNYNLKYDGVDKMKASFYGVALGADKTWAPDDNNRIILGVFAAYDGDYLDFQHNGSNGKGYGFGGGAYATWANRDGWYVDALAKVSYLSQKINSSDDMGNKTSARFHNMGIGVMADIGKRFNLAGGWYIEPQVAVTFAHMTGYNYVTQGASQVGIRTGAENIYQFRGGAAIGHRWETSSGYWEAYIKAMAADQSGSGGSLTDGYLSWSPNSNGYRTEISVGVTWQIDANNRLNLCYQTAFGSKYTQPWGITFGFSHSF